MERDEAAPQDRHQDANGASDGGCPEEPLCKGSSTPFSLGQLSQEETHQGYRVYSSNLSWMDLHQKLNHLNLADCRVVAKNARIKPSGNPQTISYCVHCVGQGTFNLSGKSPVSRPGELVSFDILDMTSTSKWGYKYALAVVDEFSRFIKVFLLKERGEAIESLLLFAKEIFNRFQRHITTLRSDGEFTSNRLKLFCQQHGITHEKTAIDTSQQNGRAERMLRTLADGTRTALAAANLSHQYWCEAIKYAAYSRNCCITNNLSKTSFEFFYSKQPSLDFLHRFGERVFVKLHKQERHRKTDPKAKEFIFVGYADDQKAFRLMDVSNHHRVITRAPQDCRFLLTFSTIDNTTHKETPCFDSDDTNDTDSSYSDFSTNDNDDSDDDDDDNNKNGRTQIGTASSHEGENSIDNVRTTRTDDTSADSFLEDDTSDDESIVEPLNGDRPKKSHGNFDISPDNIVIGRRNRANSCVVHQEKIFNQEERQLGAFIAADVKLDEDISASFLEAKNSLLASEWTKAMDAELSQLNQCDVFEVMALPLG